MWWALSSDVLTFIQLLTCLGSLFRLLCFENLSLIWGEGDRKRTTNCKFVYCLNCKWQPRIDYGMFCVFGLTGCKCPVAMQTSQLSFIPQSVAMQMLWLWMEADCVRDMSLQEHSASCCWSFRTSCSACSSTEFVSSAYKPVGALHLVKKLPSHPVGIRVWVPIASMRISLWRFLWNSHNTEECMICIHHQLLLWQYRPLDLLVNLPLYMKCLFSLTVRGWQYPPPMLHHASSK